MTERYLSPQEIQDFSERLDLRESQKRSSAKTLALALTYLIGALLLTSSTSNKYADGTAIILGAASSGTIMLSSYDLLNAWIRSNRIVNFVKKKGLKVENKGFMNRKIAQP